MMDPSTGAIKGRGTASNPANRFLPLAFLPDPEARDPDDPGPRTHFMRDSSRSAISRNDSPDIGFTHGLNPYRGCEHGCSYCLSGDTRILMADGTLRPLRALRTGDEIVGTERQGFYRRYVRTEVLDHWSTLKQAYRVDLADGTRLVASGDHRFLTPRGWKHVTGTTSGRFHRPHLTVGTRLLGIGSVAAQVAPDDAYRRRYLAGMIRGDGLLRSYRYQRRVRGGAREMLRFWVLANLAISRKRSLTGRALKTAGELRVTQIRDLGIVMPMYDITTGTGDFVAEGVISHNCYARPTHEYLGFSAGLDFESRILVKEDLPELLRKELSSPRWKPATVMMSGVTDCYQPAERRLRVTRRCLEVLAEFRNPVGIVTKNHLVTRDLDLLAELASHGAARVNLSITSLDPKLQRVMEPRTATPARRLEAVRKLADAGVPVGVMVAPVIPGLTDHEMPRILEAAAEAGATSAGMVPLRLPYAVAPLFESWLETHFPERKERVLNRIREIRGGRLNDARFGSRMRGEGEYAEQMGRVFHTYRRRFGLDGERAELSTAAFRRPHPRGQTDLFD
jgi:DNA repair photolyase